MVSIVYLCPTLLRCEKSTGAKRITLRNPSLRVMWVIYSSSLGGDSRQRNDFANLRASTPSNVLLFHGFLNSVHSMETMIGKNVIENKLSSNSGCDSWIRNQKSFKVMGVSSKTTGWIASNVRLKGVVPINVSSLPLMQNCHWRQTNYPSKSFSTSHVSVV